MAAKGGKGKRTGSQETELFAALMDHLPDAIYFKDRESRFIRINRTLAGWLGLKDPAKAKGKSDEDFFTKEFARATRETELAIMKSGRPLLEVEEKAVWADGHVSLTLTTKLPLRDAAGKIVGTFGFSRDISGRRQAEDELRRSETLYRSLVDTLPQNFLRKDMEGRVVFANRQYCATLGRPLKELLGKTDADLFPPELARKYREDDSRVLQTGRAFEAVEAHQPPGKPTIFVRVVKTPIHDADGRTSGVQVLFWEVSPEKTS
jgi:PAS domain S-box-containing protein